MKWSEIAKQAVSIPNETAKIQKDKLLKIQKEKEAQNKDKVHKANSSDYCEYHGSEWPCWDCVVEDHDYDERDYN